MLNLAQAAPVRARFGFTDDDLEDITRWVRQANIRWGFDREHRQPFGVDFVHNTWRFGIDRVLAGVAMSDDSHAWLDTTLPLDDVGSNRVELAGRLAEYVDRLQHVVESLTGARPLRDWLAALSDGITLLARVGDDDAWQTSQVQREFGDVLTDAGPRAETTMRLPDIRALLDRQLAGRPTRANFRTGTLTVCTMVPMRSVPHRVVCLVGLDDGVFPRLGVVDGDDVLARDPMTGERDIRSEDRQLLLDAIGAATEKLVITYTGANEYSGQARPPAVPLAELLDTLDVTTEREGPRPDRRQTSVAALRHSQCHPRQAGARRAVHLRPDRAARRAPAPATAPSSRRSSPARCPRRPPDDVVLADLVAFFSDPVKGFFRALDYTLPWEVDGVEDAMPVDINALEEWTVGDRMLDDMLRGMDPGPGAGSRVAARHAAAGAARLAQGHRDPRPGRTAGRRRPRLPQRRARGRRRRHRPRRGRRLTGTVSPVFGDRLVSVTYSKLDGRAPAESWIPLLALIAHDPSRRLDGGLHRPRQDAAPRRGRTGWAGPTGSAVEPAARSGRDVRRGPAGAVAAADQDVLRLGGGACTADGDPVQAARYRWKSSDRYPGEDAGAGARAGLGQGRAGCTRPRSMRASTDYACPAVAADAASRWTLMMERFDLLGPLPAARSTTVLEASAGTGKTFALAGLVTRYVAEGAATLDQMLLITFGRAASQELRERVRARSSTRSRLSTTRRRSATTRWSRTCSTGSRRRASSTRRSGCATRWPASTPRRSPPPTSSARWC